MLRVYIKSKDYEFLVKIKKVGSCVEWIGPRNEDGYGVFYGRPAHIFSYERKHGKVPRGKHLHHKCFNPACINPEHLQPVTPRENKILGKNKQSELKRLDEYEVIAHELDLLVKSYNRCAYR